MDKTELQKIVGDRLTKVMRWNGVGTTELANATGVNFLTIKKIMNGVVGTDYSVLCAIADYFMISVDWLTGRVDEMDEIMAKEYFNAARLLSYEAYLKHEPKSVRAYGYLSPWPYNLAEEIVGKESITGPLTDDQVAGFDYILNNKVSEDMRDLLLLHYKDNLTLMEIGEKYRVSASYIGQRISRAIRFLRHKSSMNYIFYGLEGERKRQDWERAKMQDNTEVTLKNDPMRIFYSSIEDLDLSVRAYNCLKRKDIDRVCDIYSLSEGKYDEASLFEGLLKIRNMGKSTAREIIEKLKKYGLVKEAA